MMCFRCERGAKGNQNYVFCRVLGMFRDWRTAACRDYKEVEE